MGKSLKVKEQNEEQNEEQAVVKLEKPKGFLNATDISKYKRNVTSSGILSLDRAMGIGGLPFPDG